MLAVRYLNPLRSMFSIITLICLVGVALGVAVLIVVLSVMEGLQQQMEERVLAFAPHYSISAENAMGGYRTISEDEVDWPALVERIQQVPGVVASYPLIENDAFVQSTTGRMTCRFQAIQPHNEGQIASLKEMLREGSFEFGEGLDEQCVISSQTAISLGLGVGDSLHLTPVGSLDQVAAVWSMIQHPLPTHENAELMRDIAELFDGSTVSAEGTAVDAAVLARICQNIGSLPVDKMRSSEREICDELMSMADEHLGAQNGATVFTYEQRKAWKEKADELIALDRDKEDGKAVKNINELVMPVDLEIIGVYQPPENLAGPNVFMPLEIAQNVMGYTMGGGNMIQGISVRVKDANNTAMIGEQLLPVMDAALPQTAEDELPALRWRLEPWSQRFESWFELIANERAMMSFVLSIITLIAAFCIMAVMFTMSMQRRREIAVMQALGATPWKIMRIFVWQGIIIGFFGALLGVGLGLLTLYYRLEIQRALGGIGMDPFPMEAHGITLPAAYSVATMAKQAIMAFIMVSIAAVIPAFFVSRQDPSKALRSN